MFFMQASQVPKFVTEFDQLAGSRIRTARKQKRWSQARLAELMGIEQATLSRIETGQAAVTATHMCRAADALGVPREYFIALDPPEGGPEVEAIVAIATKNISLYLDAGARLNRKWQQDG